MRSVVALESIQYSREWAIWTLLLSGLVVMGLAFYPAISGSIGEISVLFENPLMGTMLAAFGADAQTLASLSGFFETYASIYVTLLGCIYAALGGARRLAREEQNGIAEYLLTRPVTRRRVYWTKLGFLLFQLAALNAIVLGASFVSLEVFGRAAPAVVHASPRSVRVVADALRRHPKVAATFVPRDRSLFERALVEAAMTQIQLVGDTDLRDAGIDRTALVAIVDQLTELSPMELLADVEVHPERYRELFGATGVDAAGGAAVEGVALSTDAIVAGVRERRAEFEALWSAFVSEPERFHELFRLAPRTFLEAAAADGTLAASIEALELSARWSSRLVAPYSRADVVSAALFAFLAMVLFAAVGVALSVGVRSPEVAAGAAVALVVIAYFIDVVTSAAGMTGAVRWLSPIAMIDAAGESAPAGPVVGVVYFGVLSGIAAVLGANLFRRRDIYVP